MDNTNFAEDCKCILPVAKRFTDAAFDELLHAASEQVTQAKEGLDRAKGKGMSDLVEIYSDALPKLEKILKEIKSVKDSFDHIPTCKIE